MPVNMAHFPEPMLPPIEWFKNIWPRIPTVCPSAVILRNQQIRQTFPEIEHLTKNTILILAVLLLFPTLIMGEEKEESFLKRDNWKLARPKESGCWRTASIRPKQNPSRKGARPSRLPFSASRRKRQPGRSRSLSGRILFGTNAGRAPAPRLLGSGQFPVVPFEERFFLFLAHDERGE